MLTEMEILSSLVKTIAENARAKVEFDYQESFDREDYRHRSDFDDEVRKTIKRIVRGTEP